MTTFVNSAGVTTKETAYFGAGDVYKRQEGFLAGDLLQSAAHLAHGLRPAARGVRQQQDVEARCV